MSGHGHGGGGGGGGAEGVPIPTPEVSIPGWAYVVVMAFLFFLSNGIPDMLANA